MFFTGDSLELVGHTDSDDIVIVDPELIIALQLVDFVIHKGVHVFVELIGHANVNVVDQVFAPHALNILAF